MVGLNLKLQSSKTKTSLDFERPEKLGILGSGSVLFVMDIINSRVYVCQC
jgi:hypothetical protein